MKKILAITVITTVGLFTGNASAASISYDLNNTQSAVYGTGYSLATADWIAFLSLPKFNLSGKILDTAVLSYGGDFMSSGAIDSEDAAIDTNVKFISSVQLAFFGDGSNGSNNIGLNNNLALSATLFQGQLGADDEIGHPADFSGPDSASGLIGGLGNNGNIFNIANLAAVQGLGKFKVYSAATSGQTFTGATTLASNISTSARGQIAITYNYHDAPQQGNGNVPEPGALVLMSMGIAGFSVLRKRKYS